MLELTVTCVRALCRTLDSTSLIEYFDDEFYDS